MCPFLLRHITLGVIIASAVALAIGFIVPVGTIVPNFGSSTVNVVLSYWFPHELAPQSKSLLGGIWGFFTNGQYVLGVVLLNFTVCFPISKLSLLLWLAWTHPLVPSPEWPPSFWQRTRGRCLKALSIVGHWSMLDVLVVALVVAHFARFPLGTRILPEPGLYWFALSVVLSIVAVQLLKRLDEAHGAV